MSGGLDYSLAFVSGILGSGHCVGMCGALVSGFFIKASQAGAGAMSYLAYHGARIGVYTLIGVIAALAGVALVSTGLLGKLQGLLQIAAGLLVAWTGSRYPDLIIGTLIALLVLNGARRILRLTR